MPKPTLIEKLVSLLTPQPADMRNEPRDDGQNLVAEPVDPEARDLHDGGLT